MIKAQTTSIAPSMQSVPVSSNVVQRSYTVPGYQAAVTQDPSIAWDVYVNHYQDQTRARRDPKYVEGKGILYPRAGTLG